MWNIMFERYGLTVRYVNVTDAEFILSLRSNERLRRFISYTEDNIDKQRKWIESYKCREQVGLEYYFIFLLQERRLGVARIYNIEKDHFTQGSWIFSPDAPVGSAVLGNIISIEKGFELPGMKYLLTDANKKNTTHKYVKSYHPEIIGEDEQNIYYKLSKENFEKYKHIHVNLATRVFNEDINRVFGN